MTKKELQAVDYGADAGAGLENLTQDELSIPFVRLAQPLTPTVIEGDMAPGDIFNSATGDVYEDPSFVIAARDRNFVEYVPRDNGGGFVGIHPPDEPEILALREAQGRFGALETEDGNEIIETMYLYGLIGDPPEPVILSFVSTQIKKYKALISRINAIKVRVGDDLMTPPIFAHRWKLASVQEKNDKGTFFGWRITPEDRLSPSHELYQLAKQFAAQVASGAAVAKYDDVEPETDEF
jgi:hypothetical protein